MKNAKIIYTDTRFALICMIIVMIGGSVNIADAPLLEATTAAIILCYQVDDAGRIIDSDGRIRGWMRGPEVYGPDLELRYLLTGRCLEDVN